MSTFFHPCETSQCFSLSLIWGAFHSINWDLGGGTKSSLQTGSLHDMTPCAGSVVVLATLKSVTINMTSVGKYHVVKWKGYIGTRVQKSRLSAANCELAEQDLPVDARYYIPHADSKAGPPRIGGRRLCWMYKDEDKMFSTEDIPYYVSKALMSVICLCLSHRTQPTRDIAATFTRRHPSIK